MNKTYIVQFRNMYVDCMSFDEEYANNYFVETIRFNADVKEARHFEREEATAMVQRLTDMGFDDYCYVVEIEEENNNE